MPDGISGLLFGTWQDDLIVVQAFRSLMDSDISAIEAGRLTVDDAVLELARDSERDPGLAALDVIGWYAFRPLGGLHESDIGFHNRQYPSVPEIGLIVRRAEAGSLLFEFYANGQEGILAETDHRWGVSRFSPGEAVSGAVEIFLHARTGESPFEQSDAARDERSEAHPKNRLSILQSGAEARTDPNGRSKKNNNGSVITAGELPSVPALLAPPKPARVPWFSSVILFALAASGTFAFFAFRQVPFSGSFWRALLPDSGLNLRAETEGDHVLLSWNRRNSVVRSASGAILHIFDGSRPRNVHLDAAQVENGAVLYRPNSDDVSFRLEVHGQDGMTITGDLRMLDSRPSNAQPPDLTASNSVEPAAPPAAAPVSDTHDWQPAPVTSKVEVSEPAPPPPETPVPSAHKTFDISRLKYPPIPKTNSSPLVLPPAPTISSAPLAAAPPPSATETAQRKLPLPPPTQPPSASASVAKTEALQPPTAQIAANKPTASPVLSPPTKPATQNPTTQIAANKPTTLQTAQTANKTGLQSTPAAQIPASKPTASPALPPPTKPAQSPATQLEANKSGLNQPAAAVQNAALGRYIPPKPTHQVLPDISELHRSVIDSTPQVNVIVTVDKNGHVTRAQVRQSGRKKPAHAIVVAAENAARQWVFEPARLDGQTVASEHSIIFQFAGR